VGPKISGRALDGARRLLLGASSQQHQRNGDQGRWKEAQDDQTNHAHAMLRLCGAPGIET